MNISGNATGNSFSCRLLTKTTSQRIIAFVKY